MKRETIALHAGYKSDPTTKSAAVPIYQTTSYTFDDTQHGADLFNLNVAGNIYTRIMNPTTAVLEERVAQLEGGIAALALASGMASVTYAVQTLVQAGDNIIATQTLYGGTYNFFAHTLPRQGIEVRFIDPNNPEEIAAKTDERTRLVYCESIGNPAINVVDIPAFAQAAHAQGLPLVVDNTVPSPALFRPIEYGADIVVQSLTKYIGGHGTTIGGAIIDSGKFQWAGNPRFDAILNHPDPSYHGVNYCEHFGAAAYIARARVVPLRNTGAALSPQSAFLLLQGLETLALRMERHCENAEKVAAFLQNHPQVAWVNYPALASSPYKALIDRDYNGKASGLLSFGIKGGREAGAKFIDALQLFLRLVNIGDAKSLATHPATTTHRQLSETELAAAGVPADMIRLSIGIEHIDDLLADLEQALAAAK
ncbi:aminotransferase class V-fold PLP-dependent enzyme [Kingella negevensis]|uniref:O-acetylhomoserine aminocarboxypropyltransferase/cysteine synthase family protein n=1 Tax=Kingella negevensis TaxID=1522312 RepID=UPI002542A90B|nr:aminotransferase class V-fold PLP-dependent enzyme [Kingella negevensis]MDK4681219.1 aminotransferase class V-fold PLP-dependent enzyme [Kingella negevensis]MDK4683416.1 aminotransferase class V-fold PLP-dependent enzyme [Kingella negevensis]MDK4691449.1 aminotransferase class V-fold PLP-dependent enzyme [Kingella negevensis]MDK4693402.1 aminotransferase class V-fold PLP-dependent enzyme [Kingella negevensis]MDK4700014.1 aminotransferase class V-fold PLP-dependent enzyme [Kingella negevensi